jgi:O-methyltransferase
MNPDELRAFDTLLAQAPAGARIEFGVFHGDALRRMAAHDGETIGVDSFEGMPEPTERDIRGDWIPYPRGRLKADPPDVPGARLVRGWVPDVLAELPDGPYAFAHVDMDQYDSTLAALQWLRPRMVPNGIVCCDDWFADRDWLAAGAINALARDWPLTGTAGRKAWWVA